MKRLFLLVWIAAAVAALADGEAKAPFEWSSFDLGDIKVMRQVAEDFLCGLGGGEVPGEGDVDFFVLRGKAFEALAPDLRAALDGWEGVCIGQYQSDGVPHRVLYSVDDPPVRLGVFRQEAGGRWTACPDPVPLPDPAAPNDARSLPDPDDPRYARAAEIGGERHATPPGNALLQLGADALWRTILP